MFNWICQHYFNHPSVPTLQIINSEIIIKRPGKPPCSLCISSLPGDTGPTEKIAASALIINYSVLMSDRVCYVINALH